MGVIKYIIFCSVLVLSLFACFSLYAQQGVERIVEGERYLVHTVEPGNTLYGIARAYSADIHLIKQANRGGTESLSIGQEILIPRAAIDKREARRSEVRTDGAYLLHTVQRKETLFSISRQYGISVKDITELNPDAVNSLSTGAVLTIPIQLSTTAKESYLEPARNDTFQVHQVRSGETAYSIARQYGISTDSLLNVNPQFRDGLPKDVWVVVPVYKEAYLDSIAVGEPQKPPLTRYGDEPKNAYNIVLMLPFELQQNDSLAEALQEGKRVGLLTGIALDFYRGARVALDSLEKLGFRANVSVVDQTDDLVSARELLKNPKLKDAHLIIGPMHRSSLAVISEHSHKNRIYLVSPNSFSNPVFSENPYLYRAEASRETMVKYLANFVAIQHTRHNVLMVSSESPKDWPARKAFKHYYNEALTNFPNALHDSIPSITRKHLSLESAPAWLKKDTLNVLVVPSNEPAFISDFITRLLVLHREEYPIQLYGLDQWVNFDNIEADYKNRFKLRLVVPNHLDFENDHLVGFLKKFRNDYHTEPGARGYGYLGYDLMMFFGKALLQEGMEFGAHMDELRTEGAMGNYRFGRRSEGEDFENKSVLILEYDKYRIKRVN